MKIVLDKRVVSGLSHGQEPVIEGGDIVGYKPCNKSHYIILDDHRDAPTGFGLRVSRTVKTYVIRRRVNGKVKTVVVGHHPDLLLGSKVPPERNARIVAAQLSLRLVGGEDVNATKRATRKREPSRTLGDLFDRFVHDYTHDPKRRVRHNTLLAVDRAKGRLGEALLSKFADQVTWQDLNDFFGKKAGELGHKTAAEQTIRWVSAVYNHANKMITLDAVQSGQEPVLLRNPARIFAMTNKMRSRAEIERDIALKKRRNPISQTAAGFRKWLDYVLDARTRPAARTGADFLITTLVLGARKTEVATLRWSDRIGERSTTEDTVNYLDLRMREVHFNVTKNGHPLVLPLPDFLNELMLERRKLCGESHWVFPVVSKSKLSETKHYSDVRSFIEIVRRETGVRFTVHDLRRTFANLVNDMALPSLLVKQLLNHKSGDVTALYTALSSEQLLIHMNGIEKRILSFASKKEIMKMDQEVSNV